MPSHDEFAALWIRMNAVEFDAGVGMVRAHDI